jgi:hypothetical protein
VKGLIKIPGNMVDHCWRHNGVTGNTDSPICTEKHRPFPKIPTVPPLLKRLNRNSKRMGSEVQETIVYFIFSILLCMLIED